MKLPGEFSAFIGKKMVFCLVVGGLPLPTPLVVRPLKKTLFYVCLPLVCDKKNTIYFWIDGRYRTGGGRGGGGGREGLKQIHDSHLLIQIWMLKVVQSIDNY